MNVQEKLSSGYYEPHYNSKYLSKEEKVEALRIYHEEVARLEREFIADVVLEKGLANNPAEKLIIGKAFEYGSNNGLQGIYHWVGELLTFLNEYEILQNDE